MKFVPILFLFLTGCSTLFRTLPPHPDVIKYNIAGIWKSGRSTLSISCAGRIEVTYDNAYDMYIEPDVKVGGVNVKSKTIKHHVPADEIQGDIKKITDTKIFYWALWDAEFDFTPPAANSQTMDLDGMIWNNQSRRNCKN